LTVTDVNLLVGRSAAALGAMPLDRGAAERALAEVAATRGTTAEETLSALLDIADARMALAIENLCVRDGVDARGGEHGERSHTLVAFGGAGGQHACSIASRLGLARIVFPHAAGFMCATGVAQAKPTRMQSAPVLAPLAGNMPAVLAAREAALEDAEQRLASDGFVAKDAAVATVALRLVGQEASIEVPLGDEATMTAAFRARFERLFGYAPPPRAIEVEAVRVEVESDAATTWADTPRGRDTACEEHAPQRMWSAGAWHVARVLNRAQVAAGATVEGPAIIADIGDTAVIDAGWRAVMDASGDLVAERTAPPPPRTSTAEAELFSARLESIALGMGHVLERTALSPNIRDRLDFSCAVLDAQGLLVQNAPHLPVHLGALGVCTRAVMGALELGEGDIAVTNHPAFGGSHLPDVTTVAPVFVDGRRVAFVAVRAHHAEIGGTRPGSFPPDARSLAEEGVVLPPFHAVRAGAFDAAAARARFADAPYPSRNPDENLADLMAQIAATRHGVEAVRALAAELAPERFARRCEGELDRAERALRRTISAMPAQSRLTTRMLDDGTPILAAVAVADGRMSIGLSSPVERHPRNFNAPFAVTQAATIYALRLLVDEPIPMNEGLLRAVELRVEPSMLSPAFEADPTRCPPVVAGNVETSQTVVALLLEAFRLCAESQSTMNNVLFGDARFGVYETLGGGAGAGPYAHAASAVHVHMSNTRLTDVDVLERRAPVVIREFRVRRGSGGHGAWRGGDGLVRGYEFRAPVSLSFFGSRRVFPPLGLAGGSNGMCGTQSAVIAGVAQRCDGAVLSLELGIGDRFTVETPGGAGFGNPEDPLSSLSSNGDLVVDLDTSAAP
jgi:5-oxoprolinase (ATP-hydrolysing)